MLIHPLKSKPEFLNRRVADFFSENIKMTFNGSFKKFKVKNTKIVTQKYMFRRIISAGRRMG